MTNQAALLSYKNNYFSPVNPQADLNSSNNDENTPHPNIICHMSLLSI